MTISIGFKGAEVVEQTNLPERLKVAGFQLLTNQELGEIVTKADGRIDQLAMWTHKLDLTHWMFFFACQIPVLVLVWLVHGLTMGFVVFQTIIAAIISILSQVIVQKLTLRRARTTFKEIFGMGYTPTIDQVKRIESVSKWMAAIGQMKLEDGRTGVAVSAPALKTTLFVVDTYRK